MIAKKSHHLPQTFSPLRPVPILQPSENAGRRKILPFFLPGDSKGERQGDAEAVSCVSRDDAPPAHLLTDRETVVSLYTLRYKDCPTLVWHDLTWGTVVNFAKSNILLGACEGWIVECPDGERLTFYQVIAIQEGGLVS